jgi:type I restriction enzyme M protein
LVLPLHFSSVTTSIQIPLPALEVQNQIEEKINRYQQAIAANRELIARFEKKIQATLARVWGEEAPRAEGSGRA